MMADIVKNLTPRKDFFISYNSADCDKAEWIAWVLEEKGYSSIIQLWDFLAGEQFPVMMQNATIEADRMIACLSKAYFDALFTQPEWSAFFVQDPTGKEGKLIPIRIQDFDPPGMFRSMVYIDLVGLNESQAQEQLLTEIKCRIDDSRKKPKEKPSYSRVEKRTIKPKPVYEIIPIAFHQLRFGRTDELVGREEALAWLEAQLFRGDNCISALSSLQGAGGIGKTFLARAFAEKFHDKATFLPVYLGETKPFDAGMQFLWLEGFDTAMINCEEKLIAMLHTFYANGSGILFLDDVRTEETKILFPQVDTWKVLLTTRDKTLARKLCGDRNVKELDVLSGDESITLMRNVLGSGFAEERLSDYQNLCGFLAHRPYSVRLAAGYLAGALDPCPRKLLERLKTNINVALDDEYSFECLTELLHECIEQLEAKSLLSMQLVRNLAVCADEGINALRFLEWQGNMRKEKETEIELGVNVARELGIVLVEESEGPSKEEIQGKKGENKGTPNVGLCRKRLRLHTDILRVVREETDKNNREQAVDSLIDYLEAVLVDRKYGKDLDRSLHGQVFSLRERFGEEEGLCRRIFNAFWIHLWRTGELQQAFELGEMFRKQAEATKDKYDLQRSYGNKGLILSDWGRFNEAMELHKKEESICLELGNKDGLQRSYGNQAGIFYDCGRFDEAIKLYKKQESVCLEIGNKDGLNRSYSGQGLISKEKGDLKGAIKLYKKEEALCIELGDKNGLSRTYSNQAEILRSWGHLDKAMELHKKKEIISLEIGNKNSLQISYFNQALILQDWGRLDEAMEYLKKQESICRTVGLKPYLKKCYYIQIEILEKSGKQTEADTIREKLVELKDIVAAT